MKEIWRDIPGYEGIYQVSNLGRVLSIARNGTISSNKLIALNLKKNGSVNVTLHNKGDKTFKLHRLVAQTFIPNPDNKSEVIHLDFNKQNNVVSNLAWATHSENQKYHGKQIGDSKRGPKSPLYGKKPWNYGKSGYYTPSIKFQCILNAVAKSSDAFIRFTNNVYRVRIPYLHVSKTLPSMKAAIAYRDFKISQYQSEVHNEVHKHK